jgi:hypothetical protein
VDASHPEELGQSRSLDQRSATFTERYNWIAGFKRQTIKVFADYTAPLMSH